MSAQVKLDKQEADILSLFGISGGPPETWKPLFGSATTIPATDGIYDAIGSIESDAKGELRTLYQPVKSDQMPTTTVLASTSGSFQEILNELRQLIRQSRGTVKGKDIGGKLIESLKRDAIAKFRQGHIQRIRDFLWEQEHPIHFHAIPATIPTTDLRSGELIRVAVPRIRVYSLLPKTVKGARFYKQTDEAISLLSGPVVWLNKSLCSTHTIETDKQLVEFMNEWVNYIDPLTLLLTLGKIEEHHSWLLSPEAWEALLPERAKYLRECLRETKVPRR